jgi:hypothetical protein
MSAPAQPTFENLRDLLFAKQTRVRFLPDTDVRDLGGGNVEVLKVKRWIKTTIAGAVEMWKAREMALKLAIEDPFRNGHEPEAWGDLDWLVCRKRVENPGIVVEILLQGGQGSGKSYFGARCINRFGIYNPGCLVWCFSTDELNSKSVMQPAVYAYLPKELRTATGKKERTKNQKIIFTTSGGFTGNVMGYPNGTVLQFRFHSSELATLEGPRPHFVVTDENVPITWVEAITDRLRSRAQLSLASHEVFAALLEKKRVNPSMPFPPELVSALYMGVHLVMFTPKFGYTPTVHSFIKDAVTLKEVEAELLPLKDDVGADAGFEKVPRLMDCRLSRRAVFYMHPTDNPHAGNYESFVAEKDTMTRETILWKVYGIASRKSNVMFPKFSRAAHVRKHEEVIKACKEGTLWLAVDPAPGRNMFCLWAVVNPLGEIYIVHEWPQEDDFIPGIGHPGPWAVEGQHLDGEKGPAQEPWGMGYIREAEEMDRIERKLHLEIKGEEGRLIPYMEIIDSRTGNTPTATDSETRTLIQLFGTQGRNFDPAGKESGALDGTTRVEESTKLVTAMLDYDSDRTTIDAQGRMSFHGKAPRLFVSERCTNLIFSLSNWTNADGQKGAAKDPIDCLRYLAMSDPFHYQPREAQAFAGVY